MIYALAHFKRNFFADRTKYVLAPFRATGRKGGRPPVDREAVRKVVMLYRTGEYTMKEITEPPGVRKASLLLLEFRSYHKSAFPNKYPRNFTISGVIFMADKRFYQMIKAFILH